MKNRNQIIEVFISNLANAVVHQILEKAINIQEYAENYNKEFKNSWQIALSYREKINPVNRILPVRDFEEIKEKIIRKVNAELNLRISKDYKNIDLSLTKGFVDSALREMRVS